MNEDPKPLPQPSYTTFRAPGDFRETPVLRDVAFNRHSMNKEGKHVSPYDNARIQVGVDGIQVKLVQGIDMESFRAVLSKSLRATTGIRVDTDEIEEGWDEMLRGGLQAALESQVVVFEISGVSRACTHQLVRTRKAAFHQQSQRATWYGRQPEVRIAESVWRSVKARDAFYEAIQAAHRAYTIACEDDISYQDARLILPEGTTNYILCEYPVREFLATYAYRACSMFQWEIMHCFREMGNLLVAAYPFLAPYVKISCEVTKQNIDDGDEGHHCTFQGWERVDDQCTFPWARETNRSFKSKRYSIG
jgi:thymidylate synthase ThyX